MSIKAQKENEEMVSELKLSNNSTPEQYGGKVDPEGSSQEANRQPVLTISETGIAQIQLNEGSLWIDTPYGIVSLSIGFGGIHEITSWLPHEIKIQKNTIRGNMQVVELKPSFDSVCAFNRGREE